MRTNRTKRSRRQLRTLVVAIAVAAMTLLAPAAEASLGSTSVVLSNNQVSSSSTYTFLFTTGTASVTDLVVLLPSGVTGIASVTTAVSTAATCTGTFSSATLGTVATQASNLAVGIPLSSAIVTAGTCVKVVLGGLTNPSSTGTGTACLADGTALIANVTAANLSGLSCAGGGITGGLLSLILDTASLAVTYVSQATNGVSTQVSVAPVLSVSVPSAASFSVTPTASGVVANASTTTVNVATNATSFQVQAQLTGGSSVLTDSSNNTIPLSFTSGDDGSNPPASCPSNGSGTSFATSTGGTYVSVPVNGSSTIAGLTNSKNTVVNYCWKVDLTKPAGSYSATITYLVVPSF